MSVHRDTTRPLPTHLSVAANRALFATRCLRPQSLSRLSRSLKAYRLVAEPPKQASPPYAAMAA
jgi:hypothetical protein